VTLEDGGAAEAAASALSPMAGEAPGVDGARVALTLLQRKGSIAEAVRRLDGAGVAIEDIALRRPTLDDVFIALTGRAAQPDEEELEEVAA